MGVVIPFTLPALMLLSPRQGEVEVDVRGLRSKGVRRALGVGLLLFSGLMLGLTLSDTVGKGA